MGITYLTIYLVALLPSDLLHSFRLGTVMGYSYLGVALGYPLLLWLGILLRGRGLREDG